MSTEDKVSELVRKVLEVETKESESLLANFIKENPGTPIGEIAIFRKSTIGGVKIWVGLKSEGE